MDWYCHRCKNFLQFVVIQTVKGFSIVNEAVSGTSLVAQWLRLCISNAGGMGSIPGRGTKIPYTLCHSQKKKQRDYDLLLVSRPRLSWAERGMLLDQSQSPVLPLSPHPQPPVIPTITLLHCSESATSPSPEHLPAAPPPAQLPEGPGH